MSSDVNLLNWSFAISLQFLSLIFILDPIKRHEASETSN